MVPVVPGGFDQDAAQMRVARLGDRSARLLGATRVLGWNESDEGHGPGRRREASRITEFGRDREGGQVVDSTEAAQPLDAGLERWQVQQGPQVFLDAPQ